MKTKKIDIYGEITHQIIEAMKPEPTISNALARERSGERVARERLTHRPYRGVNVMMLWAVAANTTWPNGLLLGVKKFSSAERLSRLLKQSRAY